MHQPKRNRMYSDVYRIVIFISTLSFLLWTYHSGWFNVLMLQIKKESVIEKSSYNNLWHEKWIIVTTIQLPTKDVKGLADIPGWKLLVVGDRKTPPDWSLRNAIYLDVQSQENLGYKIYKFLPFDSYTRKAIGYLFAIQHGAKYIYETDDDNFPESGLEAFLTLQGKTDLLLVKTENLTFNPLVHFGQSTMWPRGYPLEYIGLPSSRKYMLTKLHIPAVQQGLVNGDPDVDAIFRLTRKHGYEELKVYFDNEAPPVVLPQGTFAPYNSQNTLYTSDAFWALILPVSVTFRACDIYRSYWAQTLLWTLGKNIAYFPPNAVQKRNPHSFLEDAIDETAIYHLMGNYVSYLKKWTCKQHVFFDCVIQLTRDLVKEGFLQKSDAKIVDAWIVDLKMIGYKPPRMSKIKDSLQRNGFQVHFYPNEQNTTLPQTTERYVSQNAVNSKKLLKFISETCKITDTSDWMTRRSNSVKYTKELLVISIKTNPLIVIPALEVVYKHRFPHILYCGPKQQETGFFHEWKVSYITPPNNYINSVSCLNMAMKMKYNVNGYIHCTDDLYLNMTRINSLLEPGQYDKIWLSKALSDQINLICNRLKCHELFSSTALSTNAHSQMQMRHCLETLSEQMFDTVKLNLSTVFRIPKHLKDSFMYFADTTLKDSHYTKWDVTAFKILACLGSSVHFINHKNIKEANLKEHILDYSSSSFEQVQHNAIWKAKFCETISC